MRKELLFLLVLGIGALMLSSCGSNVVTTPEGNVQYNQNGVNVESGNNVERILADLFSAPSNCKLETTLQDSTMGMYQHAKVEEYKCNDAMVALKEIKSELESKGWGENPGLGLVDTPEVASSYLVKPNPDNTCEIVLIQADKTDNSLAVAYQKHNYCS